MLTKDIIKFFKSQNFTIVSTIDNNGNVHNSCKGIAKIDQDGKIYLVDLYKAKTFENLRQNPNISITAVDEHKFRGYCLKGKAKVVDYNELKPNILKEWEEKITSRVTQRVIKNIRGEKGHSRHPEVQFPKPEYMIVMEVKDIVNLTPYKLR